jgi:hypothetical protein
MTYRFPLSFAIALCLRVPVEGCSGPNRPPRVLFHSPAIALLTDVPEFRHTRLDSTWKLQTSAGVASRSTGIFPHAAKISRDVLTGTARTEWCRPWHRACLLFDRIRSHRHEAHTLGRGVRRTVRRRRRIRTLLGTQRRTASPPGQRATAGGSAAQRAAVPASHSATIVATAAGIATRGPESRTEQAG